MRRITLLLAILAVGLAGFAGTAAAADHPVLVDDGSDAFYPARVAMKPGDTVTWTNPINGGEKHNVVFEDGSFTYPSPPAVGMWGPITKNDFPALAPAKYPYYCAVHGAPGGVGMSGVIYVNAQGKLPPMVAFTVAPNPAQTGQTVTFDAGGSSSVDASGITKFVWDFGDGSPSVDTGITPTTSHSFATAGTVNVKLIVTDTNGLSDDKTIPVVISAPAPGPGPGPSPPATTTPANPAVAPPNLVSPLPSADRTPPSVSAFGVTNAVFAPGRAATPTTGRSARKAATGTTFRYRLSKAATVKIDLQQLLAGRRKGKACVKPSAKLKRARRCVRAASQGTLTRTSHAGANTLAFTGRVGARALKPGTYQAVLMATDTAGRTSARRTVTFRVVRG